MSGLSTGVPLLDVARGNSPLREEFLDALAAVIDSGRFLFGPDVVELEKEIATLSQAEHAIGCASGSDALLLAMMALEIGPGDEVIVPSFSFFATVSAVTRVGATPVFVDIDPRTFNMSPDAMQNAITRRTRAVIPVHLFGQCAEIDQICQIAAHNDVVVVEDAAQAIGAAYNSRPAGSWGQIGCFSFYPTKNLGGMGDGGMLTASDKQMADQLRLYAAHGMQPRYHHQVVGINSRLDTFQAAVLRVKMKYLATSVCERQKNAAHYDQMIDDAGLEDHLQKPYRDPNAYHVWNQYSIRVTNGSRDALRQHLTANGVGSEIYYPVPIHRQKCYQNLNWPQDALPETDRAAAEILNLPIFPELTIDEQQQVVDTIRSYFAKAKTIAA
jgi:dTDP-4-amino-4,6-dideoxygalactose transaminase